MKMALAEIVQKELKTRMIEGGIHRILTCIEKLSEEQLYFRPNTNSNSINNQVLHLDGNVRQWLIASVTGAKDTRQRDEEFNANFQCSKEELILRLKLLENDILNILDEVPGLDLSEEKEVQCYRESYLSIFIHVIEHFSYHVGQITYITKMLLDIDTGYYAGMDLNKTNQ